MSADLVPVRDDNTPAVVQQQAHMQTAAVQRLGEWAESAVAAHSVAESLVQTSFVPQAFRGKPHEATAAILAGAEVGLSPMSSLRSFDVIQGSAAPRAITLRAIVQSQGHEMILEESTASRCKMRGRRRGSAEWVSVAWTMDRARDLGLAGKDGWKKQPTAMLVARATSELARLIAADAILGIGYTVEELSDGASLDVPPEAVPELGGTRKMSRANVQRPVPQPEPEQEQEQPDEPLLLNTSSKLAKAMYAGIHEAGITEDQRIPFICDAIGREIASTKEMTEDEARVVLSRLDQTTTPDPSDESDPWSGEPS